MRNIKLLDAEGQTEIKLFLNDYMIENDTWIGLNFNTTPTMSDILSKEIVSENINSDSDIGCIKVIAVSKKEIRTYFYDLNNNVLKLIKSKSRSEEIYDLLDDGAIYADPMTKFVFEIVLLVLGMTMAFIFWKADFVENSMVYVIVILIAMSMILYDMLKEKIKKWLKNIMQ